MTPEIIKNLLATCVLATVARAEGGKAGFGVLYRSTVI